MIKPTTLHLLLTVCLLNLCLASTPTFTSEDSNLPEYRTGAWKEFMQEFVPIAYIRKRLNVALSKHEEAKKIMNYFEREYGREKVVNISLLKERLLSSTEYEGYSFLLGTLFNIDLIFDLIYLHENNLSNFIIFFIKEAVDLPIPHEIISMIQRFLVCLSYEKEIRFDAKYYYKPKFWNRDWGVALLGRVSNTTSHFWMIHYKNKNGEDNCSFRSQLRVKVYEPTQKRHILWKNAITIKPISSFDFKKQFTFFESKSFQNLYFIGLEASKYLMINSVGSRLHDHNNRVEYGILEKNRVMKSMMGVNYFWEDIASYHSQNKVHILGATCNGIVVKTFDSHFNNFLPPQHGNNLLDRYAFYKVFTEKNSGHIWGLSDAKITSHYQHYQEHRAALLFDLCKETTMIECVSKTQKVFSYLDTCEDLVALSQYQDSSINFFDKRVSFEQAVATYSLEKIEKKCSIQKIHFLSDPKYLLAKCQNESYLIDIRYATPVLSISNFSDRKEIFLKNYNVLISTYYGISKAHYINYISIEEVEQNQPKTFH